MSAHRNAQAIRDRLAGERPTRFRAAVIAGTAGVGTVALVYRLLREPGA